MNETLIRKFLPKDQEAVLRLREKCLGNLNHLAIDGNFLQYFTRYPGVQKDGILVAERNTKIVGLEIISTYQQKHMHTGKIILFAAEDLTAAQHLLSSAEEYCLQKGVDLLMAVPPPQLAPAFKQKNWDKYVHSALVAKGIRLVPLLQAILETKKDPRRIIGNRKIIIALEDEIIQITNQNNGWKVEEIHQPPKGVPTLLTTDKKVLLNILFGNKRPLLEYLRGNIKIERPNKDFLPIRFLRKIRSKPSIFGSLADKI